MDLIPIHSLAYNDKLDELRQAIETNRKNNPNYSLDTVNKYGVTALQSACYAGNFEICKLLVESGARVDIYSNPQSKNYTTALHLAAASGKKHIVQYLLCRGADPNALDFKGLRPDEVAKYNSHKKIAKYLRHEMRTGRAIATDEKIKTIEEMEKDIVEFQTKRRSLSSPSLNLSSDSSLKLFRRPSVTSIQSEWISPIDTKKTSKLKKFMQKVSKRNLK